MTQAKAGDTVAIHYKGTLTDGIQFDTSERRDPLRFTLGSGQIIAGLDAAITGMSQGEKKSVTIAAAEAYGDHRPEAVQAVPRAQIPAEIPLEVGAACRSKPQTARRSLSQ